MVNIEERNVIGLPVNNQSQLIRGLVVRGIVGLHVGSKNFSPHVNKPMSYLAREETGFSLGNVIDSLRFADAIVIATSNPMLDPSRSLG